MPSQEDWKKISGLKGDALKIRVFSVLQELAQEIQIRDQDDPLMLSAIPRLADLIAGHPELSSFREAFSALARSVGLWNYIDREAADPRDRFIAEAVRVLELGDVSLHREQVVALNTIFSGKNLILSAPTSFGKSLLIDALLASGRFRRVVIILPTIALLDEFRRRLSKRFVGKYKIIMYHSETAAEGENTIFLGTQERLISRKDLGNLDLAVVDEFYKLDQERRDERSIILNAAVYKLLRQSKQFFFLGPNIEGLRFSPGRWEFTFLRTRFSTVAVDTFDLRRATDREAKLLEEATSAKNWPVLIFVSSPDRANQIGRRLAEGEPVGEGKDFAAWISANFGPGWDIAETLGKGIGLHHGRIPRAVASHIVRLFNSEELPILLCTSTLIEGVNTAAKSVMIYDKSIDREDFDFFTFSNIKGRAGRLGQHHVGSVYLFHSPPDFDAFEVQAPLFGDLSDAPDGLAVHVSEEEKSPSLDKRVNETSAQNWASIAKNCNWRQ